MSTTKWRHLLVLGLTSALAACGGATTTDPPPTPPSTVETFVESSVRPTTTSAPASTTEPTASTTPPSTTTDDVIAQIEADFRRGWEAFIDCAAFPSECDSTAIAKPGSDAALLIEEEMASLARAGFRARLDTGPRELVFEETFLSGENQASITTCIIDGTWLVDPRNDDDPTNDIIVNDELNSYRTEWLLENVGGAWLRIAGKRIGVFPNQDFCG
jgi:hypothetical protein